MRIILCSVVFLGLTFHGFHVDAQVQFNGVYELKGKKGKPAVCEDRGIWLADSLVDCKFLGQKSDWGIDVDAAERCKRNNDCCQTCKRLGLTYNPSRPTKKPPAPPSKTSPTKAPPAPPSKTSPTKAPSSKSPSSPADPGCKDDHVWIADMSVECRYLETPSRYGLDTDPDYYCRDYPLTDCCETCSRLMSQGKSSQAPPVEATTTTTTTAPTTTTTSVTTRKVITIKPAVNFCRDIGILTPLYGIVSCKYLEKKSHYRIHENPLHYCRNPFVTWCCETCARIRGKKPVGFFFNAFSYKTPTIRLSKISNEII